MRSLLAATAFGGAGSLVAARIGTTISLPHGRGASSLASIPWIARRRARHRHEQLTTELAPALQLVVGHLRIGRNFTSAVADVAETSPEPLRGILMEVVADSRVGANAADVLQRAAEREKHRHLSIVASAVGLQTRLGGSLSEILETVIDTIEEEDRLRRDIRSLTADGRLSAQILLAMPPVMLAFVSVMSPGYAEPLVTDPLGRMMSVVAVVLAFVGWRWLKILGNPRVDA